MRGWMSAKARSLGLCMRTLAYFGSKEIALANRKNKVHSQHRYPQGFSIQSRKTRTGIIQSISVFLQLDSRIRPITPQRSIEWVFSQSLGVKIYGLLKIVSHGTGELGGPKISDRTSTREGGWRDPLTTYQQRLCWLPP